MTNPVLKKMMQEYGLPYDDNLLKETGDTLNELYWKSPAFEYQTEASVAGAIYLTQWEKGNFDDAKKFLSYLNSEQKNIVLGKAKRKEEPKYEKSESNSNSNQSHKENERILENKVAIQYYIVSEGKDCGPYTFDELRLFSLKRDTLVWCQGMKNWDKAENIENLRLLFKETPPPIPSFNSEHAQEIIIPTPISVIVKKEKLQLKPIKIDTSKIKSELEANLGMLLIAIFFTFLFYNIYSDYKRPEMLSTSQQRKLNESIDNNLRSFFVGNTIALAGETTEYDYGLTLRDYKNINEIRMSRFNDDVKGKTIYCFIISLVVCIVGRYIVLLIKKN